MTRRWLGAAFAAVFACLAPLAHAQEQDKEQLTAEALAQIYKETLDQARRGDMGAQFQVAIALWQGKGVKPDKIESAFWLEKAAEQGHKQAINRLAWHYRQGVGVIKSVPRAEALYKQAYNLGVVGASVPLAAIYRSGEGRSVEDGGQGRVAENHAEAVRWALIGAEAGIDRGQNLLGELYRDGVGVPQDFATALKYFDLAAQQEFPLAYYNASVIYRDGVGVEKNTEKGLEYLKRAADMGHAGAMIDLALAYAEGRDLEQSYELALQWYSRAAQRNTRMAVKLAQAYEEGMFGGPDFARAYKWYYIAATAGEVSALVGRLAMKERIDDATRRSMESEGDAWMEQAGVTREAGMGAS
ncbi:tetratricopeptide repeat protein [Minwuia thermotolerans]|uniref:Sel1 repeat family protein n=1 Tax=Minwuia thermotolerans TaxID=2056226 RepID=A0A2M9G024_9PROT|nr:tetratricopeptide repeat protein [Minwuia thermotolerans]PJK29024.1 hypothetical protein CVT23_13975 [Minwuia thermotolerans]